jgi:hypothetical protein
VEESLRFVTCGWPACRQMFFLCTHCDQGHRYCSKPCSAAARRQSLRRAGAKYQATAAGKRAHCKRQNRYEARRKILTHQSPGEAASTATVPSLPATSTISVAPGLRF